MNFRDRYRITENWISEASFERFPNHYLGIYSGILKQGDEAYAYFRQQISAFVIDSETDARVEIEGILDSISKNDPKGYDDLFEHFNELGKIDSFEDGTSNLNRLGPLLSNETFSQAWAYYYQLSHELEPIHEFLLRLADYVKSGTVDMLSQKFKDHNGNLKKGATLEYLVSAFKNKPSLHQLLSEGYSSTIRNAIGHNQYTIKDERLHIRNTGITLTRKDIGLMIYSLQTLKNVILNALSARYVEDPKLPLVGTISVSYGTFEDMTVAIQLYRLWCFEKNSYDGNPLKNYRMERTDKGICSVLSEYVKICGPMSDEEFLRLSKGFKQNGCIVYQHWVRPRLVNDKAKEHDIELDGIFYENLHTDYLEYLHN